MTIEEISTFAKRSNKVCKSRSEYMFVNISNVVSMDDVYVEHRYWKKIMLAIEKYL